MDISIILSNNITCCINFITFFLKSQYAHTYLPIYLYQYIYIYQVGDVKFGELKGVDRNGNKYFENVEYPFGQHR